MMKSLKHAWAPFVTALSLSGCVDDPFPRMEDWYDLETPVTKRQFSDQVNQILKYCYVSFGENDECENIIGLWKGAQYRYITDSNNAKMFHLWHKQCQSFFASRDEDAEKECAWLSVQDRMDELEDQATYKNVVLQNAMGDYIAEALEKRNAEMLWLLERAIDQKGLMPVEEEMQTILSGVDVPFVEFPEWIPEPTLQE